MVRRYPRARGEAHLSARRRAASRSAPAGAADRRPARGGVDPPLRRALLARCCRSGSAFVGVDVASLHRSVRVQTLILWAFAPRLRTSAYVRACSSSRGASADAGWRSRGSSAGSSSCRSRSSSRLYVLPARRLVRRSSGSPCRPRWSRGCGVRAALRARLAARPRRPRARGRGLATLALVYGVTRGMLARPPPHARAGQTQTIAVVLADLVLSPLALRRRGAALRRPGRARGVE